MKRIGITREDRELAAVWGSVRGLALFGTSTSPRELVPYGTNTRPVEPEDEEMPPKSVRMTVLLPPDLVERVKNAVFHVGGLTMTALAEQAFTQVVDDLEAEHSGPFPQREGDLPRGGDTR